MIAIGWAAAAALALSSAAWIHGHARGVQDAEARQLRDEQLAQRAGAAAAASAAEAISKIEVQHVTIRQPLEREIRTNTIYRDCRADAGVVQRLNAALTGSDGAASASKLPTIATPER